jgi:hypothetical protein
MFLLLFVFFTTHNTHKITLDLTKALVFFRKAESGSLYKRAVYYLKAIKAVTVRLQV